MPEAALHIGVFAGDARACLDFARAIGIEKGVPRLSCLFPPAAQDIQAVLTGYGFQLEKADFIVMEVKM
jgi:hypothetical protein